MSMEKFKELLESPSKTLHCTESVFDWEHLLKSKEIIKKKQLIYKVKNIPLDLSKSKFPSLGYAETPLRGPCNYLKKHEAIPYKRPPLHKCSQIGEKSVVPKCCDLMQLESKRKQKQYMELCNKNYEIQNKNMIKYGQVKKRKIILKYAYTRKGDTHDLHNSGMIPEYSRSNPNFGRLPNYINKFRWLIEEYKRKLKQTEEDKTKIKNINYKTVSAEERARVLEGMKKNYKDILALYLRLPMVTDSEPKCLRKLQLENQMVSLEKDIKFVKCNPVIYICDD